jgi:hypothetical protein
VKKGAASESLSSLWSSNSSNIAEKQLRVVFGTNIDRLAVSMYLPVLILRCMYLWNLIIGSLIVEER